MGEYEVVGKREYRGHPPGEVFHAILPQGPESRAIARGDIRRLGDVHPSIQPGSFSLPEGWLTKQGKE